VSGTVSFDGKAGIGHGSKLSVRGNLRFGADFNMTAESTIVCADQITFGRDCLLSWDILVMDTDEHPLYDKEGMRINPNRPIRVGDHVWIGCKCVLLKGAEVPDNTVVAAGTLLSRAFEGENQVIGGNPPAILRQEVRWEHF
jgi:acetyltransferase-like isoleucine patch superfamily enzyme